MADPVPDAPRAQARDHLAADIAEAYALLAHDGVDTGRVALCLDRITDGVAALRDEHARLRRYCQHHVDCATRTDGEAFRFWCGPGPDPVACTCGLSGLLTESQ